MFRFVVDKSKEEEYFLDICDLKGNSLRQIAVWDIESIEPTNGTRFEVVYYVNPYGSNIPFVGKIARAKLQKMLRQEEFSSRHIAELTDAFDQIQGLMDQKEKEINDMAGGGYEGHESDSDGQGSLD